VAAAALAGALALTPVGSFAQSLLTIFEPQQFVAVPVTTSDLQGLQSLRDLSQFGTFAQQTRPTTQQVPSAAQAASASGLTVLTPALLPAGVPRNVSYMVMSHGVGTFTFSATKASAAAAAAGKTLPAMPASLDGSTLQLSIGPVVAATYGGNMQNSGAGVLGPTSRVKGHAIGVKGRLVRSAKMDFTDIPTLIIAESAMPQVSSTGASIKQIRDYLLSQPGVSPTLAAEIRAIGDPSTTLPIPIPVNRATAQTVQVQGVSGLAVGDNTGLGSGVIWQKNGMVYGVAGSLPESQILAIANSLH
jgi:hypothetical protein